MRALELACVAIVLVYVGLRVRRAAHPLHVATRLALLAIAGWIGEDSVIRGYGFYSYSASWSFFVDRVPLLIVVIWPIVVDSAGELARCIVGDRARALPIVGAAIVLADASLIEPIAVHARLWSWTSPGLFDVPIIGILGWSFFAWGALAFLERGRESIARVAVVVAAPMATHALLIASWWCAFKWATCAIAPWSGVAVAWTLLAGVAFVIWRKELRVRVPIAVLMMRLPGALFFFVLLAMYGGDAPALIAWTLAFVPPYLALARVDALSAPRAHASAR